MRFWILRGYATEGRNNVRAALALPAVQAAPVVHAHALYVGGTLAASQSDYVEARKMLAACLELRRGLGNPARDRGHAVDAGADPVERGRRRAGAPERGGGAVDLPRAQGPHRRGDRAPAPGRDLPRPGRDRRIARAAGAVPRDRARDQAPRARGRVRARAGRAGAGRRRPAGGAEAPRPRARRGARRRGQARRGDRAVVAGPRRPRRRRRRCRVPAGRPGAARVPRVRDERRDSWAASRTMRGSCTCRATRPRRCGCTRRSRPRASGWCCAAGRGTSSAGAATSLPVVQRSAIRRSRRRGRKARAGASTGRSATRRRWRRLGRSQPEFLPTAAFGGSWKEKARSGVAGAGLACCLRLRQAAALRRRVSQPATRAPPRRAREPGSGMSSAVRRSHSKNAERGIHHGHGSVIRPLVDVTSVHNRAMHVARRTEQSHGGSNIGSNRRLPKGTPPSIDRGFPRARSLAKER